jgi:hypothetical protein
MAVKKIDIIYRKVEGKFIGLIPQDDTAGLLHINPSTLSSYLTRNQIKLEKVKIKNLVYFYADEVKKLIESINAKRETTK